MKNKIAKHLPETLGVFSEKKNTRRTLTYFLTDFEKSENERFGTLAAKHKLHFVSGL